MPFYYLSDDSTYIVRTERKKPDLDDANADADNSAYNQWWADKETFERVATTRLQEALFSDPKYTPWSELRPGVDFGFIQCAGTIQQKGDLEINES
jgi:hypothetical protein